MVTAVTIWLDQLYNGAIAIMASKSNLYQVMFTLVIMVGFHLLTGSWLIRIFVAAYSLAFDGMFYLYSFLLIADGAISGLVCGEIGVEVSHDGVPRTVCPVPRRVGYHV